MQKKKLKLPIFFMALFALTALFHSAVVYAQPQNEEIQMEVVGGYNGVAKLGAWTPIQVKVSTLNRPISGEIQVEASVDQGRKIIVAKPVELAAGGEQTLYFETPVISANRQIDIRLVEKKKTLAEESYKFSRLLSPEIVMIGVLSEDPEAFGWLNGNVIPVMQGYYEDEKMKLMMAAGQMPVQAAMPPVSDILYQKREAVVVSLNRNSFPETTEVVEGFDYIFISKYDTGLLSEAQHVTLEGWVDTGGILMLGTGLHWQKVYHGLSESLKPFAIQRIYDYDASQKLKAFTGREVPPMNVKLAGGELGFEYITNTSEAMENAIPGQPIRYFEQDIIVGDEKNPLAINYRKGMGHILVFTFDPASEPFVSWQAKGTFMDYTLRHISGNTQRFYDYGGGFVQRHYYGGRTNFQHLATEIPSDKKPPFGWMMVVLAIYIILAGPVLYLILKKKDKRDWAWGIIPVLAIVFLAGMYLFGFRSRYHSAVMNTVSLIQVQPNGNEAIISSYISVFNDKRGTLKLDYDPGSGLQTPFAVNQDMYYGYHRGRSDIEGRVVGKLTMGQQNTFEQYDVMLWTPMVFSANRTVPFDSTLLDHIYLLDGKLKGSIHNTSLFDLLDTVIIIGTNIIPIGDIYAGDTMEVDASFYGEEVYKRPEEYLDGEFGRTHYPTFRDYPPDYQERMRRRRLFENHIYEQYHIIQGKAQFLLLARNEQAIEYGLTVNDKEPQKYHTNMIRMESQFVFEPGQVVEIPGGIIWPAFFPKNDVGWQEGFNGIYIYNKGEMEFMFTLPEKLAVTELQLSIENYIPLHVRYSMDQSRNPNFETEILSNQYAYYLYNVNTHTWDEMSNNTMISENPSQYIGVGREVLFKVSVLELGQTDRDMNSRPVRHINYYQELLSMPEIRVKGVAK